MAKIESLPDIHWSPAAALHSTLEDVDNISELMVIYRTKDDVQQSRSANLTNRDALWMLEIEKRRTME